MEERYEKFTFGSEIRQPFTLDIRYSAMGRKNATLSDKRGQKDASKQSLAVLEYLVRRAGTSVAKESIHQEVSPEALTNVVEGYISELRGKDILNDDGHQFIQTISGFGYKFALHVKREANFGNIKSQTVWDRSRFYQLLRNLKREEGDWDLRVVTTGLDAVDIRSAVERGLRVKIIFMNPKNKALIDGRYALRRDKLPARCIRELIDQIEELNDLAIQFPVQAEGPSRGSLELFLSDAMPCGIVVLTRKLAVLGVFLAHTTYMNGPMFEIDSECEVWKQLNADWERRWEENPDKQERLKRTPEQHV